MSELDSLLLRLLLMNNCHLELEAATSEDWRLKIKELWPEARIIEGPDPEDDMIAGDLVAVIGETGMYTVGCFSQDPSPYGWIASRHDENRHADISGT